MFSYDILEDNGIIVLAVTGQIAVDDFKVVAPAFFADTRSKGIRKLLLDYRELQGRSSKETENLSFFARIEGRSLFDRAAVVYHPGVRNEADEIHELFRNAGKDVRLFRPEQYEAAFEWLKSDSAADALA